MEYFNRPHDYKLWIYGYLGSLVDLCQEQRLTPEQLLWTAVMKQAYDDKDWEYFKSSLFNLHCSFVGIKSDLVLTKLKEKLDGAVT